MTKIERNIIVIGQQGIKMNRAKGIKREMRRRERSPRKKAHRAAAVKIPLISIHLTQRMKSLKRMILLKSQMGIGSIKRGRSKEN